ncbi:hypothetical protein J4410_05170 [Candidatus Woesearchaeota archaeon]|nr:hypothetical protein [Candidatus Woesearchaeota archaeon]
MNNNYLGVAAIISIMIITLFSGYGADYSATGFAVTHTQSYTEWQESMKQEREALKQKISSFKVSAKEEAYNQLQKTKEAVKTTSKSASLPSSLQQSSSVLSSKQESAGKKMIDKNIVGSWRPLSEAIFYESGTSNWITPVSRRIELSPDGSWNYGSSHGTWSVEPIKNSDWNTWKVASYGPSRKIILNGWNKGIASGPVEESSDIDFFWVIYKSELSLGPAMIQIKFGH